MKYFSNTILLRICFVFLLALGSNLAFSQLTLKVDLKNTSGQLFTAVYNSEDTYLDETRFFRQAIVSIKENPCVYTISDLPPGTYAIAIFQDVNNNNVLDKNLFGIPKEPYAFSNNARGHFGPPSFSAAKLQVTDQPLQITISLNE